MAGGPDDAGGALVAQVTVVADYDTLREVANQLTGLFVDRERSAGSDAEKRAWQDERQALLGELDKIEPGTPQAAAALRDWPARLATLRGQTG